MKNYLGRIKSDLNHKKSFGHNKIDLSHIKKHFSDIKGHLNHIKSGMAAILDLCKLGVFPLTVFWEDFNTFFY